MLSFYMIFMSAWRPDQLRRPPAPDHILVEPSLLGHMIYHIGSITLPDEINHLTPFSSPPTPSIPPIIFNTSRSA